LGCEFVERLFFNTVDDCFSGAVLHFFTNGFFDLFVFFLLCFWVPPSPASSLLLAGVTSPYGTLDGRCLFFLIAGSPGCGPSFWRFGDIFFTSNFRSATLHLSLLPFPEEGFLPLSVNIRCAALGDPRPFTTPSFFSI